MKKSSIAYWSATLLLGIAYILMGAANYFQPGGMDVEIAKSGYPPHFFELLGVWQVLGGVVIMVPRLPRLKEWGYAGIFINLTAAVHHHVMAGDGVAVLTVPFLILAVAAVSYATRPPTRCLQGFSPSTS